MTNTNQPSPVSSNNLQCTPSKRMRHDDTTLPLPEETNETDIVKPNVKQKLPFEKQVMQNSSEQFVPDLEIRDATNHIPRPNIIAPPQIHRINSSSTSSR